MKFKAYKQERNLKKLLTFMVAQITKRALNNVSFDATKDGFLDAKKSNPTDQLKTDIKEVRKKNK